MRDYYPNPFDFVPFPKERPIVKTHDEWAQFGTPCTGYFEIRLKALTPVHIVGNQESEASGKKITKSFFSRRHNKAFIPSSTIRGCLRAFLEAACNCWASQLTPYHERKRGTRHIGFMVTEGLPEAKKADQSKIDHRLQSAVSKAFYPDPNQSDQIDLASYLFGGVLPKGENEEGGPGWKGRIIIEDASIDETNLAWNGQGHKYEIPDIFGRAFMGGAHPSTSSWWYMFPFGIQKRGGACEFIGQGFRGRKFYYHQNPQNCVVWYFEKNPNLYQIPLECLQAGSSTQTFRIYFEELPAPFLNLLLFLLFPGRRIRHKLGYGKPYGYGSIEFELLKGAGKMRNNRRHQVDVENIDSRYEKLQQAFLHPNELLETFLTNTIHQTCLEKLAQILWFEENSPLIFTYPPFAKGGFLPSVSVSKIRDFLDQSHYNLFQKGKLITLTSQEAKQLAEGLQQKDLRTALHFEVYQEHAEGYRQIQKRTFFEKGEG